MSEEFITLLRKAEQELEDKLRQAQEGLKSIRAIYAIYNVTPMRGREHLPQLVEAALAAGQQRAKTPKPIQREADSTSSIAREAYSYLMALGSRANSREIADYLKTRGIHAHPRIVASTLSKSRLFDNVRKQGYGIVTKPSVKRPRAKRGPWIPSARSESYAMIVKAEQYILQSGKPDRTREIRDYLLNYGIDKNQQNISATLSRGGWRLQHTEQGYDIKPEYIEEIRLEQAANGKSILAGDNPG